MKGQKGIAPLLAASILLAAFVVGLFFQKVTDKINHPIEQISEQILASHGIDIDFSADKINAKNKTLNK